MKKLIAFAALLVVAASFCFADFKVKISDELDCVVHNHEVFTSYLSTKNGIPYVVTWTVTNAEVLAENVKRKDAFKKCGCSLDKSYKGTRWQGRDRGHMCPCDDKNDSEEKQKTTFLMCNMVPQTPQMNRKTWLALEKKTRELAKHYHKVEVASGPIYEVNGDIISCFKVVRYFGKTRCWICFDTFSRDSSLEEIERLTGIKIY